MNRLFSRWVAFSLALAGLAVGAPPAAAGAGSEDVFVDRFEVGVTGVLVDGEHRYLRRGGEIVVPTECEVSYQVMIEATPQGAGWPLFSACSFNFVDFAHANARSVPVRSSSE